MDERRKIAAVTNLSEYLRTRDLLRTPPLLFSLPVGTKIGAGRLGRRFAGRHVHRDGGSAGRIFGREFGGVDVVRRRGTGNLRGAQSLFGT